MKKMFLLLFLLILSGLPLAAESYSTTCKFRTSLDYAKRPCVQWETEKKSNGSYFTTCAEYTSLDYAKKPCTWWDTTN